jgi:hypothetical protein
VLEVPLSQYYWFGTCLRYLQDAKAGRKIGTPESGEVLGNLARFFNYLDRYELQVTKRAASSLRDFHKALQSRPPAGRLTRVEAKKLETIITALRHTLEAELRGFRAFVVTPKRMETRRLLADVPSLLAPGSFQKMPDVAQHDFTEAGKCLAFERSTAVAFHLLRSTESVLRAFYSHLVRRGRCELMWGPMVQDLQRRRRVAGPHGDLLKHLDHIRRSFRNPTQHPEKIYDIQEVQDLWGLCVDAVNRMASALP